MTDDSDAPLPSAECPWCGGSTVVGDRNTGNPARQVFFVYCDSAKCSAMGPACNNEDLAVIAWNQVVAPMGVDVAARDLTPIKHYKAFLAACNLNFVEKGQRNNRTGEGHITLIIDHLPHMLDTVDDDPDRVCWDGEEIGVRFRFDLQTGKLLAVGTGD